MEDSDKDVLHPQALGRTPSVGSTTDEVNPETEQEQQDLEEKSKPDIQPKSNRKTQETPKPKTDIPSLSVIEFRIQHLQNRLLILQNAQEVKKKADEVSPVTCDDSEGCELEEVLQELEVLQVTKKELEKEGRSSGIICKPEILQRGIYTLPHLQTTPTADQIFPVEHLGKISMLTQCPSCKEVICTQIQSERSEAMWLLCCLMSMVGCVAGCCLIPFYVDSIRKVTHYCPQCQAKIHIHRPF